MKMEVDLFPQFHGRTFCALMTAFVAAAFLSAPTALADVPEGEDEKTIYFIGVILSKQAPFSTLSPEEVNLVAQGIQDSLSGVDSGLDPAEYGAKVQSLTESRMSMLLDKEKSEGIKYTDTMGKKEGAQTTPSGLILISETEGSGASPAATDTVKVHYHGTLRDGTVFDSSLDRGEPVEFALNRVIPCWTEGVAKMKAGGKATLVCPPEIAYGDRGAPPMIPGGATLTFVVDLIEVKPTP
ncbi:MAG: FKBP-type peptidyl-prolyl cis-trans isomerase [Myxococcota bacterium]|nr:FKBP-type peptidyl-prolyl cis-trans isomerase [Myxococcota bacterium]